MLRSPSTVQVKTMTKIRILTMVLQVSFSGVMHNSNVYSQDDLPKAVVRTLSQGSNVMSMDFHPQQQTILLGLYLKIIWSLNIFLVHFSEVSGYLVCSWDKCW